MNCRFLFILVLASLTVVAAQDRKGQISGQVVDALTQEPLAGVNVVLVERPTLGAATDANGNFLISAIAVGEYSLRATLLGYEPVVLTNVVVSTGRSAKVKIKLQETTLQQEGVDVRADYFGKAGSISPLSTIGLNAAEVRRSPGANQDMQRIVQTLPGVGNSTDQTNELIVRGGAPNENLTVMDNIEIPTTNHYPNQFNSGGPINMVNVDLIEDIQFSTGGFPAQFGDKLSSVMNISIREGDRRRAFAGDALAHFAGVGGVFEGGFADGRGSWLVSVRQSLLETLDKVVGISSIGLTAIPKYWDAQWKTVYDLSSSQKLIFSGIYGNDKIFINGDTKEQLAEKAGVIDTVGAETVDFHSQQDAYGLTLKSLWGSDGYSLLTLSGIDNEYNVNVPEDLIRRQYDATGKLVGRQSLGGLQRFGNNSRESRIGLRYDLVYELARGNELSAGALYETSRKFASDVNFSADTMRFDFNHDGMFDTTVTSIPGQIRTDLGLGDAYRVAGYASDKFRLLPELTLTLGVRYDYFSYSKQANWSPRASLSYELFPPTTSLNLAYGEYYQTQSLPLYSDNRNIGYNRNLANSHARHFVAGIDHILGEGLKFSVEGYYKKYDNLAVSEQFIHSADVTFRSDKNFTVGERTSYGIEFFLQQKQVKDLYATVSYSYSQTYDNDSRIPHQVSTYPSSYDYPHILTVVAGKIVKGIRSDADRLPLILRIPTYIVPLSDDMEISFKFRYQSGNVYTPKVFTSFQQHRVGGRVWSEGTWIDSGEINSARYPAYHRLDLQWISRYHLSGYNIEVVFILENVYNRANVFMQNYLTDGTKETVYQFSFFPVVGMSVEF